MLKIQFDTFTLSNGLTVILHPDRSSPLVAVDLWYHVGSKDESPGRTGFAHLFEHLMFMGSRNAPYPAFDAIMESWGGHNNGTTSNDRTNYYEIGPRNLLETFLWLEADRLATLPDVITEEELEKQRKVVLNERRQSYENRPYGRAELAISEAMYRPEHPYHWPTIGSQADIEAATVADVRAFFDRYYRPSNASLVVAGDFDLATGRALVERYFGWLPRREPPPRAARPLTPHLAEDIDMTLTDRVQLPRLRLAWHAPALFAPDDADLDLAAHILGGGKSSRLYRALVFDRRIAQDVFAYQGSQILSSLFQAGATAKPGYDLDEIGAAVDAELNRFAAEGPTEPELERARNTHLADFYKGLDHLQTRADLLNHYQHLLGNPDGVGRDLERYGQATRQSVRAAFARTLAGKRLALRTVPEPVAAIETPNLMGTAPVVGPLPTVVPPVAARSALANGLDVVLVQRQVAPIVSAALMIRSGGGVDAPSKAGLASLTAEMLDEGAGARDALGIADELERLGADLWLGSGRDGSQLSLQAPRETFAAALDIAADVLIRPRLSDGDWERVLSDRRTACVQRRDQPEAVVGVVSDRVLFGDDHPYGRPTEGLEQTIGHLTLDDVRGFHAGYWRPNHASLVVAGDFDEAQLRGRLDAVFADWKAAPVPASPVPPPWPPRPRLVIVDRPGASQSVVRLVAPGTNRLSVDRSGLAMLNAILGGSFTSRLNFNLREKNGFTYGASSSFAFLHHPGSFAVRSAVFAESTAPAVREMLSELGGLRERPASDEEHAKARATLLMRVAESLSTTGGIAATFGEIGLYDLPLDEPLRFAAALERTTADDLRALAARYIDPDATSIVIVGDRAAIEPGLRELGLPAAVAYDADGEKNLILIGTRRGSRAPRDGLERAKLVLPRRDLS